MRRALSEVSLSLPLHRTVLGALFVSASVLAGAASAEPWQLAQAIGPVWYGQDDTKLVSLGPNTDVPGGSTVVTGEGGRAMLVRGDQTMLVGPNAVVIIPDADKEGITTVLQRSGEVTFDVDRQKVQHFAVETPYLAAVVKGTNFTVNVDDGAAQVNVNRGLVEVADLATGERVDTAIGQRAWVDGIGQALKISGEGLIAMITPGVPRAPSVAPLPKGELRALQNKATGTIQALNQPVGNGSGDQLAILGAGAASGGGSGPAGPSGGTGIDGGGSSGKTDIAPLDLQQISGQSIAALDVVSNTAVKRRKSKEEGISPMMFVAAAGLMTLLAVGLAYVRRNT
jgi:hypothetical protein